MPPLNRPRYLALPLGPRVRQQQPHRPRQAINRVTACWADLDAHGINIVGDLQRRSGRSVSPIFMEAALHDEFAFLEQDDKQVSLARDLAATGHPDLRALAAGSPPQDSDASRKQCTISSRSFTGRLLLLAGQAGA